MPLSLGDRNETVREWRRVMAKRFAGYARTCGELPQDTDEYGPRARAWQWEYERRTGQPIDGIVSDDDLRSLGIAVVEKPWLFTVHGTGQPDPLGPGIPADVAREVLDLYRWQPIGNYSASAFPMWPSIMQAYNELVLQINSKLGKINLAGYSQGAVAVAMVLKHEIMDPNGSLHHRLGDVQKVVFWGNPMRQKGIAHFDEWIYEIAPPESHGIVAWDLLEGLEDAPFEVRDYAHRKDMYACNFDNDKDEYKRAICKIVFKATDWFDGPDSIVHQLIELGTRPLQEGLAMAQAMIDALTFFSNLNPHNYNWEPAVRFLREGR